MFKQIAESVLNEISAEDAYSKFYNSIDKNIFDEIVAANNGKFDKLTRFVMDAVKNELIGWGDAKSILNNYNQASNNIRIAVKSKFDKGEYDSPIEILKDIDFYEKNGVVTVKSIQTMGFGVIFENDEEKITYTATYEANQHFYGNTKWCTASDRMGRYDGWLYFLYYVYGNTFSDIDEIKDEYLNENLKSYTVNAVLMQYINKKTNKTYQIQVFGNGSIGQLCDEEDNTDHLDRTGMSNEALNSMSNSLKKILKLTDDCIKKECVYQLAKEELLNQKKYVKKMKMFNTLKSFFSAKRDLVKKESNKIFSSNLLSNKDFVQKLVDNFDNILSENENLLKEQGYVNLDQGLAFKNGLCVLLVKPCYGNMKTIQPDFSFTDCFFPNIDYEPFNFYYDDENTEDSIFNEFRELNQSKNFQSAIIFADVYFKEIGSAGFVIDKINRIINVFNFESCYSRLLACRNRALGDDMVYSFFGKTRTIPNTIIIKNDEKQILFSLISGKFFDMEKELNFNNIVSLDFFNDGKNFALIFTKNNEDTFYGCLLDYNLNLKKTFNCYSININNRRAFAMLDKKTGQIFFATDDGIEYVGDTDNSESFNITINYRGKNTRLIFDGKYMHMLYF